MSVETKIREASARRAGLLHTLQETDSAVPDLAAQKRYVAQVEKQVAEATNKLKQLEDKRKKELKEHESYRDSVMKRLAFKISGKTEKFEARAAKEEREYFDVLQEEHQAGVMKDNLDAMLEEARRLCSELEAKVVMHLNAQKDLDGLYEAIFSGPSPGFAEEDDRESEMNAAIQAYHKAQSQVDAEGQAVNILSRAQQRLKTALIAMEDALHASQRDIFGGGTFMDMMERSALSQADNEVRQARMMVTQAQRFSARIRNLPPVRIAQGDLLGDVFFDNIFTDLAFHQKIRQSSMEVQQCARALDSELGAARQRHVEFRRTADRKGAMVQQARMILQEARAAAFERIAVQAGHAPPEADVSPPDGPPPAYTVNGSSPAYTANGGSPAYTANGGSGANWWE